MISTLIIATPRMRHRSVRPKVALRPSPSAVAGSRDIAGEAAVDPVFVQVGEPLTNGLRTLHGTVQPGIGMGGQHMDDSAGHTRRHETGGGRLPLVADD